MSDTKRYLKHMKKLIITAAMLTGLLASCKPSGIMPMANVAIKVSCYNCRVIYNYGSLADSAFVKIDSTINVSYDPGKTLNVQMYANKQSDMSLTVIAGRKQIYSNQTGPNYGVGVLWFNGIPVHL